MKAIHAILAVLLISVAAQAADINGHWWVDTSAETAAMGNRGGSVMGGEFQFKVSGDVLTGSASEMIGHNFGWNPIADGKITGDTLSFTSTKKDMNGNTYKVSYTGKAIGKRIELTINLGDHGGSRTVQLEKAR